MHLIHDMMHIEFNIFAVEKRRDISLCNRLVLNGVMNECTHRVGIHAAVTCTCC